MSAAPSQVWASVFGTPKAAKARARDADSADAADAGPDVAMMQLVAAPPVESDPEEGATQMQLCVFDGDAPEAWIAAFTASWFLASMSPDSSMYSS